MAPEATVLDRWAEMTGNAELLAALRADGGDAPCCHWGRCQWSYEPYALALGLILEDSSGESHADEDGVNSIMSCIVNDGDGSHAEVLISARHAYGDLWRWFDMGKFGDGDEITEMFVYAIERCVDERHKEWIDDEIPAPHDLYDRAEALKWKIVCDYWDKKEQS